MKNFTGLLTATVALLTAACSPMDDKYREFIEDGPITYLTQLNGDEIQAIGERNRVHFIWPPQTDPRGVKAEIYWSNKLGHHTQPVDPSVETSFYVNDLAEASYIFEISIFDDQGHSSIPVTVTATVYGDIWESYLTNRAIIDNVQQGADRKISYRNNTESSIIGTDFEWVQDGAPCTVFIDSSAVEGLLPDFKASSFRYRTRYVPEPGGVDVFYSPWQYYVENVTTTAIDAGFDKPTNSFTLPTPNDGNWTGYEFRWTDKTTGEAHTQSTDGNTVTLSDYNSTAVNVFTRYKFDEVSITTIGLEYSTVRYVDLDRSTWYAAPETKKADGSALVDVRSAVLADKNKSPYLSHLLPYNSATPDGWNSPSAHFDGNLDTYISQVKGYGTTLETNAARSGTQHSNGGVLSDGKDVWFIIDLGAKQQFNYFRFNYRGGQSNGNLKPQMVSIYGSNDAACITDESKWTVIKESIVPPGCSDASNNADMNHIGRVSGNILLPDADYRYLKMRYDAWTDGSNTMQIAELYLGYYY
ncbi:MAG: hypothetical protein LBR06_00135 [Bacteroidales bacterium]|jgi:hypothetical protein|nr:hypothetical protein [Bacteroidales bacterium]